MGGRHTLTIFYVKNLYGLRHWHKHTHSFPPCTAHVSTTRKEIPASLEYYKETRLGRLPVSQPLGTLCQYVSIPEKLGCSSESKIKHSRTQAEKIMSSVVHHQSHTEGAGRREMLPILSSLRQKLKL